MYCRYDLLYVMYVGSTITMLSSLAQMRVVSPCIFRATSDHFSFKTPGPSSCGTNTYGQRFFDGMTANEKVGLQCKFMDLDENGDWRISVGP